MKKREYTEPVTRSDHIGIFDITLAINTVLDSKYPQIPIQSGEVREGINLPSFYVDVVPISFKHQSEYYKEMVVQASIKYLTDTQKRLELIKMSDRLATDFGIVLHVKDRYLQLYDVSTSIDEDGTLSFDFELRFVTFMDRKETAELMEDLSIDH